MIRYRSAHAGEPDSIVKIRLMDNFHLDFDVFFARINLEKHPYGQDVTVNWESLDLKPERPGVFYTDANAYRIVRRDVTAPKPYNWTDPSNKIKQVASYFYPINAGLFIEDPDQKEQMVVMNDRPQGGSAYQSGRVELMINRVGSTSDQLGVWEGISDPS